MAYPESISPDRADYMELPWTASIDKFLLPEKTASRLETFRLWKERHLTGWKFGVTAGAFAATLVFLVNFVVTIYVVSRNDGQIQVDGRALFYEGSCNTSRKVNIGLHVVINLLSTALLGGSNYCMQCLSAPTRAEIDKWHGKIKCGRVRWLDIGIQSARNLRRISKKRALLWWCLCISSFPLHLL